MDFESMRSLPREAESTPPHCLCISPTTRTLKLKPSKIYWMAIIHYSKTTDIARTLWIACAILLLFLLWYNVRHFKSKNTVCLGASQWNSLQIICWSAMLQPLSYSILNTLRHPHPTSVTRENFDRLITLLSKLKTKAWGLTERERQKLHERKNRKKKEREKKSQINRNWGLGNNKVLGIKLNIMVECCGEAQRHKTTAATAGAAIEVLSVHTDLCSF